MRMFFYLTLFLLSLCAISSGQTTSEMLSHVELRGGLIVVMGSEYEMFTSDSMYKDHCVVHGLCSNQRELANIRENIKRGPKYGQVSVQHWDKDYLPYTDNLVNQLFVEDLGDVPII